MTSLNAITSPDWPSREQSRDTPVVIFLHGYGSNEADLAGLGSMLPAGLPWVSLRAPIELGYGAAAWFPLGTDIESPAHAADIATQNVWNWVDANVNAQTPVIPFGFSQGGAMATQLLRTRPERLMATIVIAGFVDPAPQSGDATLKDSRPTMFWGRGTADAVIPANKVAAYAAWCRDHVDLEEHVYPGLGHGINDHMMADVLAFVERVNYGSWTSA
jgi:phospholipase/carboxylesterase